MARGESVAGRAGRGRPRTVLGSAENLRGRGEQRGRGGVGGCGVLHEVRPQKGAAASCKACKTRPSSGFLSSK